MNKEVIAAVPLTVDLWGYNAPALSIVVGLGAVVLVRAMLISKEMKMEWAFWSYNISLTLLMVILTLCLIIDRQLTPGLSAFMGIGIGASGMLIVDIIKERIQSIIKAAIGKIGE